jgi:hypothetical protein
VASGAYWRCPICLRRVPDKVAECYCGRQRQASDGPDEGDAPQGSGGAAVLLAVIVIAAGGLAYWSFARPKPAPAVSPTPAPVENQPDAGASGPARPQMGPVGTPVPASNAFRSAPATTAPPAAPAAPAAKEESSTDSVDARRTAGRAAFEAAAANLQGRLDVLRRRVENFMHQCAGSTQVRGCDTAREELERDAADVRAIADKVQEDARKSWVEPGAVREIQERFQIRDGDVAEVAARVQEALKR